MSVLPLISVHCTRYMRNSEYLNCTSRSLYESLIAQWLEPPNGNWNLVGQKNLTGSLCTLISTSVFSVNLHFH